MRILSLPIIFTFFSICSFGQIKQRAAVDSIFVEWDKTDTPGCGLGIIKDGKLIYSRGYGMANLEYDIPNAATSVFRIGSTSKQFTAASIVLLAEKGKLSLDDNLHTFFPDFPEYSKKISVRHLLNHTSGIRDYLAISYLKGLQNDDFYTDEDIMKWLIRQEDLNFSPGEEFLYSNSGYWLLGQIVNKVAEMNMADFAKKEIFNPLGMANTHFHNDHTKIVKNRASGYRPNNNNGYRISMTTLDMIGDGGIFTTIEDIKKWDDAFYESTVLSKKFWSMMTQQGVLNNGETIDYASGLFIGEHNGQKTIRHGGAFVGFRAELIRFPEQRFSVAIFANRGDANPTRMGFRVADIFLKDTYSKDETTTEKSTAAVKPKFIKLKAEDLNKYSGLYWNEKDAYSRKIYVKNDTLRYSRSETNESNLVPVSKNEFKMMEVQSDIIVKFDTDKNNVKTMSFHIDSRDPIKSVGYTPANYTKEKLKTYSGNYYSKELDVYYKLSIKDNALLLHINDEEISSVTPVMEHLFSNNRYGTFRFQKDAKGNISEFRLAAGRVKNLKFVKK